MGSFAVSHVVTIALLVITVSASLNFLILKTQAYHIHISADTQMGSQKVHVGLISRIGGLAIFFALIGTWFILNFYGNLDPDNIADIMLTILICSLPAVFLGVAEDTTKSITPPIRLIGCCVTGLLGWFTGFRLYSVEILFIDNLLEITLISMIATIFVVAALANAMNMLDGLNGLSSGYAAMSFSVFAYVAFDNGDYQLGLTCVIFVSALLGFLIFNWPIGRIFLGDGGAYFLGIALAFIAMKIAIDIDWATQAFSLVVFAYPAWEITASISRRLLRGLPITHPEQGHLHALFFNKFKSATKVNATVANSLSSLSLLVIVAIMTIVSVIVMQQFVMLQGTKFIIVLFQFFIFWSISNYLKRT